MAPPLLERTVGDAETGDRLDRVLARWLDESRARAQERLAEGQVEVDGVVAAKGVRLRAGQRVRVAPAPPPPAPPPPPAVPVRYEDDHVAVVAKPAGLVVHAGAGVRGPTLVDALRARAMPLAPADDESRPGIVHRLDRGTSGLLVIAKTTRARDALVESFRRREVRREYWALVEGVPDPPRATIDAPLARSTGNRTRFAVDPAGRPAVTHYDLVAALGSAAEITARLETGRTHQVRVHLAAIGHPVLGDRTYGASPLGERLGLDRPALHAADLAFDHPVTGERVEVAEPLPEDLRTARSALDDREGAAP